MSQSNLPQNPDINDTTTPLLPEGTSKASEPSEDNPAPSSPQLGCYLAIFDNNGEGVPYTSSHTVPLDQGVDNLPCVTPGYMASPFEAEHPLYTWIIPLRQECLQNLARDQAREASKFMGLATAKVWWDKVDATFVLIAGLEILQDDKLRAEVFQLFGLSHGPYRICLQQGEALAYLEEQDLTTDEAEVNFDEVTGKVVVRRIEVASTEKARLPPPFLSRSWEFTSASRHGPGCSKRQTSCPRGSADHHGADKPE